MSARSIWCTSLVLVVAGLPAFSDEPAKTASLPREMAPQVAIEQALAIIDLVLEHHPQSPARQEMLLQGASALIERAKLPPGMGLGKRVSSLRSREEEANFLTEMWTAAAAGGLDRQELVASLNEGILRAAPGNPRLIPTKEFAVREQFEANRYVGIGIALGSDRDLPQIAQLFAEGPADKAGAKTNDLFVSIDGESMKGIGVGDVIKRLRGPEGSLLTVVLRQPQEKETRTLTITRGVVPRQTVHGWDHTQPQRFQVEPRIACIRITEVGASVVHELRQIEGQLRSKSDCKALVIDLRSNSQPGGYHHAAVIADALLLDGMIGRVRTNTRVHDLKADSDCLFHGWPLAVLVDDRTGSTGEWIAAALQDNRRAFVVGIPTSGSAYVYAGISLPGDENTLYLPDGILERPSGKPLLRPRWSDGDGFSNVRSGAPPRPTLSIARRSGSDDVAPSPSVVNFPREPDRPWGVTPDYFVDARTASQRFAIPNAPVVRTADALADAPAGQLQDPALKKACELLQDRLKEITPRGSP